MDPTDFDPLKSAQGRARHSGGVNRSGIAPAAVLAAMERHTVDCADGTKLEYFRAGRGGPFLVCINALGQGLLVWSRLVEHFSRTHRVICWKPRGTYEEGRPFTLSDQVADLERIVEQERVHECRLVTWCSGAKIGIEFLRRRPIATSIAIMNGTFKALPGLEHLETPYEQSILQLSQAVARSPGLAPMVMNSMKSLLLGSARAARAQAPEPAFGDLASMIVEPFQSVESTVRYSLQVVDYLLHDIAPSLAAVGAPTLLVSGEFDRISSPGMSRAVSALIPGARYGEIADSTHYGLYEKPKVALPMLESFFEFGDAFTSRFQSPEVRLG